MLAKYLLIASLFAIVFSYSTGSPSCQSKDSMDTQMCSNAPGLTLGNVITTPGVSTYMVGVPFDFQLELNSIKGVHFACYPGSASAVTGAFSVPSTESTIKTITTLSSCVTHTSATAKTSNVTFSFTPAASGAITCQAMLVQSKSGSTCTYGRVSWTATGIFVVETNI